MLDVGLILAAMKLLTAAIRRRAAHAVALVCGVLAGCATFSSLSSAQQPAPENADQAIARLLEGNRRFADGKSTDEDRSVQRRLELTKSQKPFAIIVSCSDSRVGPEVVFDQGLGDLFVIRTAGEVLDAPGLGSIEYGVEHLGSPLIVVLGHQSCGAVSAAVEGGHAPGHIDALVRAIRPVVVETKRMPGDHIDNAVRANVRRVVRQLKKSHPIISEYVRKGKVRVVGAYYDLNSGTVTLLE